MRRKKKEKTYTYIEPDPEKVRAEIERNKALGASRFYADPKKLERRNNKRIMKDVSADLKIESYRNEVDQYMDAPLEKALHNDLEYNKILF